MPKVLRKGDGQPLREEMRRQGVTLDQLSEKTRTADPTGRGVSPATIGRLTSTGRSGRDRCEWTTAWLIAEGLDWPIHRGFAMQSRSPATDERSTNHAEEV
jgi:hypothetical protein